MYPEIRLDQFNLTIRNYYALNLTAWFVFLAIGQILTSDKPGQHWRWWWLFLGMVLSYSVGASYLACLAKGGIEELRQLPFTGTGSRFGLWGGPLLFLMWTGLSWLCWRIPAYPFLDVFAISWSGSQIFAKTACLAAGCCAGRATKLPWGIVFVAREETIHRHPTQLYEMILHALTTVALMILFAKGQFRGRLVLMLACIYGIGSPIVEFFEENRRVASFGGPLSMSQMICLGAVAFGATALTLDFKARRPTPKPLGSQMVEG